MQEEEFLRNFNTPLTDFEYSILVQILPFNQLGIGVPLGFIMENMGEGSWDIYTPISAMLVDGVYPPHASTHISN